MSGSRGARWTAFGTSAHGDCDHRDGARRWIVPLASPAGADVVIDRAVTAESDDAEEAISGAVDLASSRSGARRGRLAWQPDGGHAFHRPGDPGWVDGDQCLGPVRGRRGHHGRDVPGHPGPGRGHGGDVHVRRARTSRVGPARARSSPGTPRRGRRWGPPGPANGRRTSRRCSRKWSTGRGGRATTRIAVIITGTGQRTAESFRGGAAADPARGAGRDRPPNERRRPFGRAGSDGDDSRHRPLWPGPSATTGYRRGARHAGLEPGERAGHRGLRRPDGGRPPRCRSPNRGSTRCA